VAVALWLSLFHDPASLRNVLFSYLLPTLTAPMRRSTGQQHYRRVSSITEVPSEASLLRASTNRDPTETIQTIDIKAPGGFNCSEHPC
jgi:hypothetical protein